MNWLKIIFVFQIFWLSTTLIAQNKQIEKADKRYQIKKYAEAIPLYEEGLTKNKSLKAQTRLAFCYRMNNNVDQAAVLYAEIVQNKRARPITWYYYGESLIGQGKYEEAKSWLEKYTVEKPNDFEGQNLLKSIDKIQNIQPFFKTDHVASFSQNSDSDDSAPIFFNEGIAFSSDRKTGIKVMKKKSSWTGRDFLSLYFSKRNSEGTYTSPKQLSRRLNDINKNTGTIAIAPDGTYAVFSRNSDVSNKKNIYNLMLYRADLTPEGKFKNVRILSFCGKNVNYMHPTFAPDGNTLFFTSDKKGEGGTDIFYVEWEGDDWSRPKNVGAPINTAANEGFPFMSYDGKLYFCSKGHLSYGGFDILVSERDENGNWKLPINVGKPINSPADDISIFISPDGQKGMFASSREGGDDDIYLFEINGYYDIIPSSGSNELPLTNASDFPETNIATTAISEEKNTTKEKERTLPFEPIQPFSDKEKETQEKPVKRWSTVPLDSKKSKPTTDPVETKVETVVTNHSTEENATSTTQKRELPFEPIEPFSNKNELAENSTEKLSTVPQDPFQPFEQSIPIEVTKEDMEVRENPNIENSISKANQRQLPFEPLEPFDEIEETENDSEKFQEGLATSDNSMTDEAPVIEPNETPLDQGLVDIKDYLSYDKKVGTAIFVLEKIKFEPQKYTLKPAFIDQLDELVQLMNDHPDLTIEVNAHTESIGDDRENMVLSIKRATAVAGYLIRKQIATDRVKVMGYGETQLLNHCSNGVNCSPEEHALNQRVEIKVLN